MSLTKNIGAEYNPEFSSDIFSIPKLTRIGGFDILIITKTDTVQHVLLVQLKTHETTLVGNGTIYTQASLKKTVTTCCNQAEWFFKKNWVVSLIVLNRFAYTGPNIYSSTPIFNDSRCNDLWSRSAVVSRIGFRDLFGPSIALKLEFCVGIYNIKN